MSANNEMPSEMRRKVRVEVTGTVCVTDRLSSSRFGQLVNISEEGMMVLTSEPVAENTIFQLSLGFCDDNGEAAPIDIGVECLWCHQGNNENQYWAGFYIIDISDRDQQRIRELLA